MKEKAKDNIKSKRRERKRGRDNLCMFSHGQVIFVLFLRELPFRESDANYKPQKSYQVARLHIANIVHAEVQPA